MKKCFLLLAIIFLVSVSCSVIKNINKNTHKTHKTYKITNKKRYLKKTRRTYRMKRKYKNIININPNDINHIR